MTTKTATFVRKLNTFRGDARLFAVQPPVIYGYGDEQGYADFVVVSTVNALYSGPETYIFPADSTGQVLDWGELDGSSRGRIGHAEVLRIAGYEVS